MWLVVMVAVVGSGWWSGARCERAEAGRRGKALAWDFAPLAALEDPAHLAFHPSAPSASGLAHNLQEAALSRGAHHKPNSPIYYIQLPPEPYVYVPGVGYVSRPPQLQPPPVVQPGPESNMIHLPVNFVSNAKPTGVYTWKPTTTKKPSQVTHLDKGPYVFNGRPTDIFILRDTYNSLYEDALQNFYP